MLDRRAAIRVQDRGGEPALGRKFAHDAFRLPETENPSGLRQTGFVCPAWYPQAGADLALAVFVTRPQAEAQIGAKIILRHFGDAVKSGQMNPVLHAAAHLSVPTYPATARDSNSRSGS